MSFYTNVIKGPCLRLRPIDENDLKEICKCRNHENNRKWFLNTQSITPDDQQKWWIKYKEAVNETMFIIEKEYPPMIIGAVALYNIEPGVRAEFGRLMIHPEHSRKGYAYEATLLLVDVAFHEMDLSQVYLIVKEENTAAIDLYKKVGFQTEREENGLLHMSITK